MAELPETTVLGGGIAGLAVALVLAARGARVQVLEQAPIISEVGAGLQITPNGAAVLQALGLGGALATAGLRSQAVELRDGHSGRRLVRMDLARQQRTAPWYLLHRADLIALLHNAASQAGITVATGQQAIAVDLLPGGARVTMADGRTLHPELLIGADGLHSLTRAALNGAAAPFFTRQVAWRAIVPAGDNPAPVAEVHLGIGRHLVSYPLRSGRERNIVAVEERDRWVADGWNHRGNVDEMQAAFRDFSSRVQGWLARAAECGLWGLFRHPVAERWFWTAPTAPQRGAAILGDAVHPTLPFLAQGANMALEDAWMLGGAVAGAEDLGTALAAWQAIQSPRCQRIVAAANTNARNYHLRPPLRGLAHLGLLAAGLVAPGQLLARYDWIHHHDVTREWP